MPIAPPAPGLFSITTGCFSSRDSASATGRATVSATPPGGNGTIIVIGLSGYWANAADDAAVNATAAMAARAIGLFMALLLALAEHFVELLRDAHERRALRQLAQPPRADVGAGRAHAAQDLLRGLGDRSAV